MQLRCSRSITCSACFGGAHSAITLIKVIRAVAERSVCSGYSTLDCEIDLHNLVKCVVFARGRDSAHIIDNFCLLNEHASYDYTYTRISQCG